MSNVEVVLLLRFKISYSVFDIQVLRTAVMDNDRKTGWHERSRFCFQVLCWRFWYLELDI